MKSIKGSCLCCKVSIEIEKAPESFGVCHCENCRTWTGGVYMAFSAGSKVKISGEEFITRYSSSDHDERAFCKECGSNLFFRMKKSNHYFPVLGLFGDQLSPEFAEQQYIDKKPSSYSFSNKTKNVTKSEMDRELETFLANQK